MFAIKATLEAGTREMDTHISVYIEFPDYVTNVIAIVSLYFLQRRKFIKLLLMRSRKYSMYRQK